MPAIVFASAGGRKYHFDKQCKAFEYGQQLHDWDTPEDAYLSSWADPKQHPLKQMSSTKAAMDGKLPCLSCVPAHLRELPDTENFGHEPFEYDGVPICKRCFTIESRCSLDAFENPHQTVVRNVVPWPCRSAVIFGVATTEGAAA